MVGGQLTIASAAAAQAAASGGDGVIQLDGGATLVKQDASTTTLGVGVLTDTAEIHVVAGRLIGRFQGDAELDVAAGATLGLAGSGVQLAPPAIDLAGGTIEVEPGANVSLGLPSAPALRHIGVLAGAALDVSIDNGSGPVESAAAPDDLATGDRDRRRVRRSASTAGGGILGLSDGETLSGAGMLDATLVNGGGTVAPHGALHVTGDYSQGADATLAARSARRGRRRCARRRRHGALAGTLRVTTDYVPAANAARTRARSDVEAGRQLREDPRADLGHARLGAGLRRRRRDAHDRSTRSAGGETPASLVAPSLHPSLPSWAAARAAIPATGGARMHWPTSGSAAASRSRGPRRRAIASRPRTAATSCPVT